ncbi:MAG: hypothetical protein ACE5FA_01765 [Dehalococcoidia bacterium]
MRRGDKLEDGREVLYWDGGAFAASRQKATHLKAGIIHGIASTDQVDRDGERIAEGAFDKSLDGFLENAVLLWAHQHTLPAVGRVLDFKRTERRYEFDAEFAIGGPDAGGKFFGSPPARPDPGLLHWLYERGFMRAFSVGFIPTDWTDGKDAKLEGQEGTTYVEAELIELSCCNVPSNRGALAHAMASTAKAFGLDLLHERDRAAIPKHRPAKAPEDTPWDAAAVLREIEGEAKLRLVHAWVEDGADPEAKSSYKLPHHLADGRVVFRGVAAAMGALLGARGGVAIPEAERRGVYDHLAAHYTQFDREPPEFKEYAPDVILSKSFEDVLAVERRMGRWTREDKGTAEVDPVSKALVELSAGLRS